MQCSATDLWVLIDQIIINILNWKGRKNSREHEDILLRRQVIHIVLQELIKLYSLLLNQYVIIAM